MQPTWVAVSPAVGTALVESGYYREKAGAAVEDGGVGPKVYAAMVRQGHGPGVTQLEKRPDPPAPPHGAKAGEMMAHRLEIKVGRELYGLRKQTFEPVFDIIKDALGFRRFQRFLLRGLEKADLE